MYTAAVNLPPREADIEWAVERPDGMGGWRLVGPCQDEQHARFIVNYCGAIGRVVSRPSGADAWSPAPTRKD